jgi:hypothetical protein
MRPNAIERGCEDLADLYETDYAAWAVANADLLRRGRLAELDVVHLIEELEDVGKSERRALRSRLIRLYQHLLKWAYQPERRGASWRASLDNQRDAVAEHLRESPSLAPLLHDADLMDRVYAHGRREAIAETGLEVFPATCPWPVERALDPHSWPG